MQMIGAELFPVSSPQGLHVPLTQRHQGSTDWKPVTLKVIEFGPLGFHLTF